MKSVGVTHSRVSTMFRKGLKASVGTQDEQILAAWTST